MKRHILKTDPAVFQAKWDEVKPYEIRFDDRDYKAGDELLLVETKHTGQEMMTGKPLEHTGRFILVTVTHKMKGEYGLQTGWCILADSLIMGGDDYDPEDHSFSEC